MNTLEFIEFVLWKDCKYQDYKPYIKKEFAQVVRNMRDTENKPTEVACMIMRN